MRFHLVDVFTDRPYAGNALAVVEAERELPERAMQTIAREFDLSETVFVRPGSAGSADAALRIFTPAEELPFAGHPTLGAAAVVAWGRPAAGEVRLRLEEAIGEVPVVVRVEDGGRAFATLTAPAPRLGGVAGDDGVVAEALSLRREDLVAASPPQVASSGVPYLFVHAASLEVVGRVRPRGELWGRLQDVAPAHGVIVFCLGGAEPGAFAHARMFSPQLAIAEDPATGSAGAPLAALLLERRLLPTSGGRADFVLEQGYEMGRPSRLHVGVALRDDRPAEFTVGGGVRRVARGELLATP